MLMKPKRQTRFRELRREIYGVTFLIVAGLLIWLATLFYTQAFTDFTTVTLHADSIGNQLQPTSDVKLRGVVVGQVRTVRADGENAILELGLKPEMVQRIPANVTAQLLPKSLFGERDVHLVPPPQPSPERIAEGDVIGQDRTELGVELQNVIDELYPLLTTVQPGELNAALSALAKAVDGRGDRLGENVERVEAYLREIEPHLPTLYADIRELAELTEIYGDAAPDLLSTLRNLITTSRTVVEKRDQLSAFFTGVTEFAQTGDRVLTANGDRIIHLADLSRPTLTLLAEYSPMAPCFLAELVRVEPIAADTFRGGQLHLTLDFSTGREPYRPGEEPEYTETRGPNCYGLPTPTVPFRIPPTSDGTDHSNDRHRATSAALMASGMSFAGTQEEQLVVNALLSPVMGVPADELPSIATLLFGPMARGTAVSQS